MIVVGKPEPWQCPQCKTWIRADMTEHRCPPDEGGVTVGPVTILPSGGGTSTLPAGTTWTMTNAPGGTATVTVPGTSDYLHSVPNVG